MRCLPAALLLTATLVISCSTSPQQERRATASAVEASPGPASAPASAREPVFLLTGYGPFADIKENESWQVAERLDGEVISGMRVVAVKLPVVWDVAAAKLREAVTEHRPAAAISMGVGWSGWIEVETTARNRRVNRRDVRGRKPELLVVEQGGPSTIPTRLPVEDIVRRIREMGIPVRTSDDAGGYLCNDAFYTVLRATEAGSAGPGRAEGDPVPAGFIHLPRARNGLALQARPDPSIRVTPSERAVKPVDLDGLVRAVRAAIEETARARSSVPTRRRPAPRQTGNRGECLPLLLQLGLRGADTTDVPMKRRASR